MTPSDFVWQGFMQGKKDGCKEWPIEGESLFSYKGKPLPYMPFCGVPKCIVLCADKKQPSADILYLYKFLLGDRVRRFRVVKQLARGDHIAGAFGLLRDRAPIVGVLIAKRHIG